MSKKNPGISPSPADTPSGGGVDEDWLATIAGLAILALALFGLIPGKVLW